MSLHSAKYNNWDKTDPSELFHANTEKKEATAKLQVSVNCAMGHRCLRGLTMTVAVGKDDIVGASGGNDDNSDDGHCFSCVKLREIYDYLFMERN